jgi:ABC-type multidrug transport system fused ATPase/permease subunit
VELGRHEDLLEKNGYYADLYNKQLLEEELETV